jgi:hypothetical protein
MAMSTNQTRKCYGRRIRSCALWALAIALVSLCTQGAAVAQTAKVVVETRIKEKTLSFQAGMKSTQTIDINYATKSISQKFETGVTDLVGIQLNSVRDKFTVTQTHFTGKVSAFTAEGQTASGVGIMPNINYKLSIKVDMAAREVAFSGCHDGYPSYKITVQGKDVYAFEQEILLALFGSCDISVPHTVKKF